MLQQSGQIPLGVFDTNPHQNLPGSFAAGQSHCIAHVDYRIKSYTFCYFWREVLVKLCLDFRVRW